MNAQDRIEFEKLRDILSEKNTLLGRLDERSLNTYHLVEKLEQTQAIQNGRVRENTKKIWYILGVLGIVGGAAGTALSQVF